MNTTRTNNSLNLKKNKSLKKNKKSLKKSIKTYQHTYIYSNNDEDEVIDKVIEVIDPILTTKTSVTVNFNYYLILGEETFKYNPYELTDCDGNVIEHCEIEVNNNILSFDSLNYGDFLDDLLLLQ